MFTNSLRFLFKNKKFELNKNKNVVAMNLKIFQVRKKKSVYNSSYLDNKKTNRIKYEENV